MAKHIHTSFENDTRFSAVIFYHPLSIPLFLFSKKGAIEDIEGILGTTVQNAEELDGEESKET